MSSLVFVGRIADELASSSTFVSDIGCGEVTVECKSLSVEDLRISDGSFSCPKENESPS